MRFWRWNSATFARPVSSTSSACKKSTNAKNSSLSKRYACILSLSSHYYSFFFGRTRIMIWWIYFSFCQTVAWLHVRLADFLSSGLRGGQRIPALYDGLASAPSKGMWKFGGKRNASNRFILLHCIFIRNLFLQTRENFNTTREEAESLMRKMLEVRKTVMASCSAFLCQYMLLVRSGLAWEIKFQFRRYPWRMSADRWQLRLRRIVFRKNWMRLMMMEQYYVDPK